VVGWVYNQGVRIQWNRTSWFITTVQRLVFLLLGFSLASGGCGPVGQIQTTEMPPTASPTPIPSPTLSPTPNIIEGTVTIWHSWDETQRSILFRTISVFQSTYPQVQFDVLYVPALDLATRFEEAMSQGAGPTILIAPAQWGGRFYEQGFLVDFGNRNLDSITTLLNQAALETGVYYGKRLSVPITMNGVVLYRNKTILPTAAQTFEQMRAFATTATQAGTVGADLERSFFFSGGHLLGLGGLLLNAEGLPGFQQDDYRYALEWLDLLKAFEQVGVTEFNSDNDLRLFQEGRAGLIVEGSWNRYLLAGEVGPLNLAIDPWPTYKTGRLAGFVQSEGVFLTRQTLNEEDEISWLFLQSLFSPEALSNLGNVGLIPAIGTEQLVENGGVINIGDPFVTQSIVAFESGVAYPSLPEMEIVEKQMDVILRAVFFQGMNQRAAMQQAYERILADINTQRSSSTPSP
jgi:maltose-binding protein MalE